VEPGRLEIALQHSLRSGTLRIWVDDELVLEEALAGRLARKVLTFRQHRGRLTQTLEVAPGERVVRVQVEGDGFADSRRIRGRFESGAIRRLQAEAGGLLRKELRLYWGE
jgi:hypothetical protein